MKTSLMGISLLLGTLAFSGASFSETHQHKHSMTKGAKHDPHFLDMMIEHHKDGIKMTEMAQKKAESKEIKELAQKIASDQKKELNQMQQWREKYSSASQSDEMVPKMDMSELQNAEGKEFDKKFAEMMAKHHEDGIKMSQEAIPMLENKQIKQFAQNSVKNQTREVKQLHSLHSSIEKKTSTGTGSEEKEEILETEE